MLLQEAAAGSGAAFAALYDRYESRVFNFCLRLVDAREDAGDATQEAFLSVLRRVQSHDDPVLNFSAYLFTAARHEAFKVSGRRARTDLVEEAPERGDRVGGPPAIETDPERSALLQSSQEEVRAANARLPWRHREVLALRELEGCSYDEIAQILGTNRNAVSQLIWRARANLRDELRVAAVSSVAAASEACERAQTLISQQEDGELDDFDRAWLERHLQECGACRTSKAALLEVGASYRAWLPVAAIAGMRPDVLTRGGEIVGADWSAVASLGSTSPGPGAATVQFAARLAAAAAAGAAALALGALFQDGERRQSAAERIPSVISPKASKPEAAESRAAGRAVEAARRAARRREGKLLPAKRVTPRPGAPTGPPQATGPRPGRPPVEPPASPPDAAPQRPEAPSAEPPASPPGAVPQAPDVPATPDTPSTPVQAPQAPNCSQPNQGRGPAGCPPGHGGEPPAQNGEGGRGPPAEP